MPIEYLQIVSVPVAEHVTHSSCAYAVKGVGNSECRRLLIAVRYTAGTAGRPYAGRDTAARLG
jgi:hypothetical protein